MNNDDYESLPTTSVLVNMTAGGIAGILEHCIMYPLDSVKTRLQSLSPANAGYDITTTMRNMIQKEGIWRPVRGVTAVVAGAGPAHALYFGSYEMTKELLTKVTTNNHLNYMASGVVATLIHDAVSNPMEVIKQRMQMHESKYRSVITCLRGVYQTEGASAFYRSYSTQLVMNIPHQAIHFTTYEFFQNMLNHDRKYNPPVHVVAGAAAGACAAAITTPLDVMKTQLNTGFAKGMMESVKLIYNAAGPMGFFKGLSARVLYSMPATAICWSTYEFFKFYLCGMDHSKYKSSITGKSALKVRDTSGGGVETSYVLPSPTTTAQAASAATAAVALTAESASHQAAAAAATTPLQTSSPTPPPPTTSSGGSLKTVCELTSSVASPALNLHTRHTASDIQTPYDHTGYRTSQ